MSYNLGKLALTSVKDSILLVKRSMVPGWLMFEAKITNSDATSLGMGITDYEKDDGDLDLDLDQLGHRGVHDGVCQVLNKEGAQLSQQEKHQRIYQCQASLGVNLKIKSHNNFFEDICHASEPHILNRVTMVTPSGLYTNLNFGEIDNPLKKLFGKVKHRSVVSCSC